MDEAEVPLHSSTSKMTQRCLNGGWSNHTERCTQTQGQPWHIDRRPVVACDGSNVTIHCTKSRPNVPAPVLVNVHAHRASCRLVELQGAIDVRTRQSHSFIHIRLRAELSIFSIRAEVKTHSAIFFDITDLA